MLVRKSLLIEDGKGNQLTLSPGQELTLGRGTDFPIGGDDPAMHRRFLHFWNSNGDWLVQNTGSLISARLQPNGNVQFLPQRLAPGDIAYIPAGKSAIGWSTKHDLYVITLTNATAIKRPKVETTTDYRATMENFIPSQEQQDLLDALAAPVRENPFAELHTVVPSISELADQLGWTRKKTEQKILRIVDALERAGVPEFQRTENRVPWRVLLARFAYEQYGRS